MEKKELYKRFEEVSKLNFSNIKFIDLEGNTWVDSKSYSFIELFENNVRLEYYFIIIDNTQGGYYQLEKSNKNKNSEKISTYDPEKYETDFGDLEEKFDQRIEVYEGNWCDIEIHKVINEEFPILVQNKINEFLNQGLEHDEFYEWFLEELYGTSYGLSEGLMEKLGLNYKDLENVYWGGLEIESVEEIKNNPFIVNCGNTYGDRTQECFLIINRPQ